MKLLNYLVYSICWSICVFSISEAQDASQYRKEYAQDYQTALVFLKENKGLITKVLNKKEIAQTVAIVFPEIVRFSEVNDFLQTTSLELLYTRFGTNYANFSIGHFQMKPSFIEEMESYVKENALDAYKAITVFKNHEIKAVRQERIQRLKTLEWQLRYLACFRAIVSNKFTNTRKSKEQQLRFFAAAYNRGFQYTEHEINKWLDKRTFPHGLGYHGVQYSYTDIAWDFYIRESKKIFN